MWSASHPPQENNHVAIAGVSQVTLKITFGKTTASRREVCPGLTRQAEPRGGLCGSRSGGHAGTGDTHGDRGVTTTLSPSLPTSPAVCAGAGQNRGVRAVLAPGSPPALSLSLPFFGPHTVHAIDQSWWKENPSVPSVSAGKPTTKGTEAGTHRGPGCQDRTGSQVTLRGRETAGIPMAGQATKPASHRKRPEAAQAAALLAPPPPHRGHFPLALEASGPIKGYDATKI